MYKKHSIKTSIVAGILLMTTVGLLVPSTSASIETDADDGFWTDNFVYDSQDDAAENLSFINCSINVTTGTIVLNKTDEPKTYDFVDTSHQAYSYSSILFNPFYLVTNVHLTEYNKLDKYLDIPGIKIPDDEKYASWSSAGWKKVVVHYFRFKLDVGPDLEELAIHWKGKADNDVQIKLYFLQHLNSIIGLWKNENHTQSHGSLQTLTWSLTEDQIDRAVDDENYIDICIVANAPSSSEACTLYTDYIKVASGSEEIYTTAPAYVETKNPIDPKNISSVDPKDSFYWGILTWDDYERNDATVKYHVLYYENSTKNYTLVDEKYLDGNKEGFTESPISLTKMGIDTHKLPGKQR